MAWKWQLPLRIMFITYVPAALTTESIQSHRVVKQSLACDVMNLKQYCLLLVCVTNIIHATFMWGVLRVRLITLLSPTCFWGTRNNRPFYIKPVSCGPFQGCRSSIHVWNRCERYLIWDSKHCSVCCCMCVTNDKCTSLKYVYLILLFSNMFQSLLRLSSGCHTRI